MRLRIRNTGSFTLAEKKFVGYQKHLALHMPMRKIFGSALWWRWESFRNSNQCYGAEMFCRIRIFPSRIRSQKDFGSRSASKNLSIFTEKLFLTQKYDQGCSSRIRDLNFLHIPDQHTDSNKEPKIYIWPTTGTFKPSTGYQSGAAYGCLWIRVEEQHCRP
jgi:hypothetical protein